MTFKKGDLVMVVKPTLCCNRTKVIGQIHTVRRVIITDTYCEGCGHEKDSVLVVEMDAVDFYVESSRLIKIDPPAEEDQETTNKELEVVV